MTVTEKWCFWGGVHVCPLQAWYMMVPDISRFPWHDIVNGWVNSTWLSHHVRFREKIGSNPLSGVPEGMSGPFRETPSGRSKMTRVALGPSSGNCVPYRCQPLLIMAVSFIDALSGFSSATDTFHSTGSGFCAGVATVINKNESSATIFFIIWVLMHRSVDCLSDSIGKVSKKNPVCLNLCVTG